MSGSPLKSIVAMTLVSVILVGLGAGAGYLATGQSNAAKADDAGATAAVTFDKRTLQNLGIELGKATLSTFVEFREVQAVIQDAPLNFRPVAAPLVATQVTGSRRPVGAPLVATQVTTSLRETALISPGRLRGTQDHRRPPQDGWVGKPKD